MIQDREEFRPDPGRIGSPVCVAVLLVLNRWRGGLRFAELVSETGLDEADVRAAVTGLNIRRRIQCSGRGTAALWGLVHTAHFEHLTAQASQYMASRGMQ